MFGGLHFQYTICYLNYLDRKSIVYNRRMCFNFQLRFSFEQKRNSVFVIFVGWVYGYGGVEDFLFFFVKNTYLFALTELNKCR